MDRIVVIRLFSLISRNKLNYRLILCRGCYNEMMKSRFAPKNYDPSKMSKAEFWREHEKNRLQRHNVARNEFITEKHGFMLIYAIIGVSALFSMYYFISDFSFGDKSALHFKAAKRIVYQSPIAKNVLGEELFCFGVYGKRKRNPYYKMHPLDATGSKKMLEMRFHAVGEKASGQIYAEALCEGMGNTLNFQAVRLCTKEGEVWDLKKPTKVRDLTRLY